MTIKKVEATTIKKIAEQSKKNMQSPPIIKNTEIKEKCCAICGELIWRDDGMYETSYDCKCVVELRKKERLEKEIKRYSEISSFEKGFKNNTFELDKSENARQETYMRRALKFAKNIELIKQNKSRCGILLCGETGTGKTYLESAVVNQLHNQGNKAIMFKLTKYVSMIKADFGNINNDTEKRLLELIKEVDLVIIDDIGSEQLKDRTGWTMEKVYNLIDCIYESETAIIISTNNEVNYLEEHLKFNKSNKIMSRLQQMCEYFIFDWNSRRVKEKNKSEKLF